jgi:hypothetical protein
MLPFTLRPLGKTSCSDPGNGSGSNNNRHSGGNGNSSKNSSSGGSRGGNTGNTTTASTGPTNNDSRATSLWLTYVNPWQGHITMYPDSIPTGQQHLYAFLATPGNYTPLGFMLGQQPRYQQAAPILSPGWTSRMT